MNSQVFLKPESDTELHQVANLLERVDVDSMKQGRPTPKRIREFVEETKRNAPALTHRYITDQVVAKFGEEARIDQTTVGRILRKAGLNGLEFARNNLDEAQRVVGLPEDIRPANSEPEDYQQFLLVPLLISTPSVA